VFPNLMINRYGPWMDTNVVQPTSPTSCTVRFDWWLEPRLAGDSDTVRQVRPTLLCSAGLRGCWNMLRDITQAEAPSYLDEITVSMSGREWFTAALSSDGM
jgi:hypothetical protein